MQWGPVHFSAHVFFSARRLGETLPKTHSACFESMSRDGISRIPKGVSLARLADPVESGRYMPAGASTKTPRQTLRYFVSGSEPIG